MKVHYNDRLTRVEPSGYGEIYISCPVDLSNSDIQNIVKAALHKLQSGHQIHDEQLRSLYPALNKRECSFRVATPPTRSFAFPQIATSSPIAGSFGF